MKRKLADLNAGVARVAESVRALHADAKELETALSAAEAASRKRVVKENGVGVIK